MLSEAAGARESDAFASWDPPAIRPKLQSDGSNRKGRHGNQERHDCDRGIGRRWRRHAGRPHRPGRGGRRAARHQDRGLRAADPRRRILLHRPGVAADEIFAQGASADVLVVFRWADFARFRGEISVASDALVLSEATEDRPSEEDLGIVGGEHLVWVPVPFAAVSRDSSGTPSSGSKNVVALGILGELLGLPAESLERALARRFGRKKASVLQANMKAFEAGREFAASRAATFERRRIDYAPSAPRILMSGNEGRRDRRAPCRLPVLRRATRSRLRPRSCTSSPSGCPAPAARSFRPRTSSRRSAPSSEPRSPASRR